MTLIDDLEVYVGRVFTEEGSSRFVVKESVASLA